jgi:hypothetical protein
MEQQLKINMETCWDIISESCVHRFTANVEFGSVCFFLHEEDYSHIFELQNYIREVISPKYQLLFLDFGMKAVVVTLTKNLL